MVMVMVSVMGRSLGQSLGQSWGSTLLHYISFETWVVWMINTNTQRTIQRSSSWAINYVCRRYIHLYSVEGRGANVPIVEGIYRMEGAPIAKPLADYEDTISHWLGGR